MPLSKAVIIAYIASLSGSALWLYGFFEAGHPALIDWHTYTPWWIADFLPSMESEIGMALVFVSPISILRPRFFGWRADQREVTHWNCWTGIGEVRRSPKIVTKSYVIFI